MTSVASDLTEEIPDADNYRLSGAGMIFIVFFLALDIGQSAEFLALDTMVMAFALGVCVVLPSFLENEEDHGLFSRSPGRGFIAVFGLILGTIYGLSVGVLLPEIFSLLPFTLLVIAAVISSYAGLFGFIRLRPVR